MYLLTIADDGALLIKSGMLFHKRLPRNFIESMPIVMLFAAGICSRPLVLKSYLTSFLIAYSCIKGGLVLLGVVYISIISIPRFGYGYLFHCSLLVTLQMWIHGHQVVF